MASLRLNWLVNGTDSVNSSSQPKLRDLTRDIRQTSRRSELGKYGQTLTCLFEAFHAGSALVSKILLFFRPA